MIESTKTQATPVEHETWTRTLPGGERAEWGCSCGKGGQWPADGAAAMAAYDHKRASEG